MSKVIKASERTCELYDKFVHIRSLRHHLSGSTRDRNEANACIERLILSRLNNIKNADAKFKQEMHDARLSDAYAKFVIEWLATPPPKKGVTTYKILPDGSIIMGNLTIPANKIETKPATASSEDVLNATLYYEALMPAGQQFTFPRDYAIGCNIEAFASPFNHELKKWYGVNPEVDAPFGSLGRFEDYKPQPGDVVLVNPPYVEEMLLSAALASINHANAGATIVFHGPNWKDAAFYIELVRSSVCKRVIEHKKGATKVALKTGVADSSFDAVFAWVEIHLEKRDQ